jgi:tRNA (mo5U34)-methyltransferase
MVDMKTDREIFEKTKKLEIESGQWYHTMDLGNGEVTNGIYDHRPLLKFYGFPESLEGKRVLDVGCADGFFSFLFERRGAKEVVAIDAYESDLFLYAKEKLGSKVKYLIMDVYDISPEKIGYFDFVFCGTLLIHLTDPIRALRNIRSVIKNGELICANPVVKIPLIDKIFGKLLKHPVALLHKHDPEPGWVPTYWIPTEECLKEMLRRAGFDEIEKVSNFILRGFSKTKMREEISPHIVFKARVMKYA